MANWRRNPFMKFGLPLVVFTVAGYAGLSMVRAEWKSGSRAGGAGGRVAGAIDIWAHQPSTFRADVGFCSS
jgi:hypothetical protein